MKSSANLEVPLSASLLSPGDAAPLIKVFDSEGEIRLLGSDFWKPGPVLLTFLRHFG
jgi:hypothetical protein